VSRQPNWTDAEKTSKLCTKCGEAKLLSNFYTSGKTKTNQFKYASWCKICISEKQATYHKKTWGDKKLAYTAFKRTKTVRHYLTYLRSKAIQRKKASDIISLDALELLWITQKGRCALTGWQMTFELAKGSIPTNCSIDRIDSNFGYEIGNVQLVCRAANVAKSNLSECDFINLCIAVVENQNG
jgi:hypothetical protein